MRRSTHKFSKTAVSETSLSLNMFVLKRPRRLYIEIEEKTNMNTSNFYKQRKIVLKQNTDLYKYTINPRIKMAGFRLQVRLRNRLQIMYTM